MKTWQKTGLALLLTALVGIGCFFLPYAAGVVADRRTQGSRMLSLDETVSVLPEQTFARRLAAVGQADMRVPLRSNPIMDEQQAQLTGINELELLCSELGMDSFGEVWAARSCRSLLYLNEKAEISIVCWEICYRQGEKLVQVVLDDETGKILSLSYEVTGDISVQKSAADMAESYLHYLSWIWDTCTVESTGDGNAEVSAEQNGYGISFVLTSSAHSLKINKSQ